MQALDRRWWPGLFALPSALFLPLAPAHAQSSRSVDIVVRYVGPADCSSAAEFIERAAPRLPALRLVEGRGDVGLEVILRPSGDGVAAELVIHLEEGGTLSRSILASSCDEAVEAISFVASVALDPGASEPVLVQSSGPEAGSESEPTEDDADEAGRLDREEPTSRRRRRDHGAEVDSVGLLAVGAAVGFGVAPEPLLGPELSLSWASGQPGVWSPAVVVQAQYVLAEGIRQQTGVASFHQGRANVSLCPSAFAVGVLSGRPCLGVAGGWVESEGSEIDVPSQATRPFFDTNLAARVQVALGRQSAIILSGYLGIPWIRDSYRFDSIVFHRTAAVTGGLSLSIGARLW